MTPRELLHRSKALAVTARHVHRMAGRHRRALYAGVGLYLLVGLLDGVVLGVAVPLLSTMLGEALRLPPILNDIAAWFGRRPAPEALLSGTLWLVTAVILKQVIAGLARLVMVRVSTRIVTDVRAEIVGNLLDARFTYLDRLKTGGLRQVIAAETSRLSGATRALVDAVGGLVSLAVTLSLLIVISPRLTLVAVAFAALLVPVKVLYAVRLHRAADANVRGSMDLMDVLNEALMGIRSIKLTERRAEFTELIRERSYETETHYRRVTMLETWEPLLVQGAALGLLLVLVMLARWMGLFPVAEVLTFFLVLYRGLPIVNGLNASMNAVLSARPSLEHTARLFFLPASEREPVSAGGTVPLRIDRVAAENLAFAYPKRPAVLNGVSLEARRGEIVALAGASGSGKSTILHLMVAMYAPSAGRITIDGRDVAEWPLGTLRRSLGLATQDVHLFNNSVANVIRGGQTTLTVEAIEAAAREAEADGFILSMPKGYDTVVGERGVRLSGGQRQRLLLAQVLARRPPVLLLDEATSALDFATERRVVMNLQRGRATRIAIVVTHRLANLAFVDRIYFLDGGRIAEEGTHAELMARRGLFWAMSRRDPLEPASPAAVENPA